MPKKDDGIEATKLDFSTEEIQKVFDDMTRGGESHVLGFGVEDHNFVVNEARIMKSHDLVLARYGDITQRQIELMHMAISLIPRDHPVDQLIAVKFSRDLFDEVYRTKGYSNRSVSDFGNELAGKVIRIRSRPKVDQKGETDMGDSDESSLSFTFLSHFLYHERTFYIAFNPALNRHLLNLKNRFVSYTHSDVLKLKSPYQYRMFDYFIMMSSDMKERMEFESELSELKDFLETGDGYPNFKDFRTRVLDPAVDGINKHTNIEVKYDRLTNPRTGAVERLRFHVRAKSPEEMKGTLDSKAAETEATARLMALNLSRSQVNNILKVHTGTLDELEAQIQAGMRWEKAKRGKPKAPSLGRAIYLAVSQKWTLEESDSPPDQDQPGRSEADDKSQRKSWVNTDLLILALESDPNRLEDFVSWLDKRKRWVTKDLVLNGQMGIRDPGVKDDLAEYAPYFKL